ncbi:MAG: hypothetical protein ABR578_12760 [Chromatocurvus sp.]
MIKDNNLVALALLVAGSLPDQKTLMIRLIVDFILLWEPAVEAAGPESTGLESTGLDRTVAVR